MLKFSLFSRGQSELYIMNQCWNTYPVALYFPKTHVALQEAFNTKITQLRESGLIMVWMRREIGQSESRAEKVEAAHEVLSLTRHLVVAFAFLSISLGVFIVVSVLKLSTKKKYSRTA